MDPMQSRKAKHIDVCLTEAVDYQTLTTGFERVTLPYHTSEDLHVSEELVRT